MINSLKMFLSCLLPAQPPNPFLGAQVQMISPTSTKHY